jgi:hypothetical protein
MAQERDTSRLCSPSVVFAKGCAQRKCSPRCARQADAERSGENLRLSPRVVLLMLVIFTILAVLLMLAGL